MSAGDRPRILALMELPPPLRRRLEAVAELQVAPAGELSDGQVAARLDGHDGLLTLLVHQVGEETLTRGVDRSEARCLRLVANCAVGVDNIDLAAARRRGITVTHTPGVLTDDTADLTWALLLATTRRVVEGDAYVRSGAWRGWGFDLLLGRSLSSLTLGVVGAGRIGRAVLERAAAFGMRRLYASRSALPPEEEERLGVERRSLEGLLQEADVVSLHVPLNTDTFHLLDGQALGRMKPGAFLINTARGPVVEEAALAAALDPDTGHLAGAGLDVFEEEPRVHPRLLELPNVVLLPHLGSATRETRFRMAELSVESLETALVDGEKPRHTVVDGPWAEDPRVARTASPTP